MGCGASTQPEDTATESSADNIAELLTVAELRHQLQEEQTARLAAEENVEHLKAMLANQIAIGQPTKPVASPHDMSRSPGADTATLTIICVLAGSRDLQHRVVATLYENPLQLCTLEEIIVELFGFGAKSTFKLMWRGSDDVSIDMETDTDMAKAISCALVVFRGVLQIEVHPDEPFVSNSMNLEDTSVVEAARVHFLQLSAGQLVITGLQMQTLCSRIGISLNDQKCKSMLKRLDPQNQDAIRWTDFENWLQKRHTKKRMKPAAKSKGKGLKINTVRSPESVASQLS